MLLAEIAENGITLDHLLSINIQSGQLSKLTEVRGLELLFPLRSTDQMVSELHPVVPHYHFCAFPTGVDIEVVESDLCH